jgi:hypothetical protein
MMKAYMRKGIYIYQLGSTGKKEKECSEIGDSSINEPN